MPKIALLEQLTSDFPTLTFRPSDRFYWAPEKRTVYYSDATNTTQLLHEAAHGALNHRDYEFDIELLAIERDAWAHAKALAKRYAATFSDEQHHAAMESYRDWMHARSTCPSCQASGVQTAKHRYQCLACLSSWLVNDARLCGLKRSLVKN